MLVFMKRWDTREHLKHTRGSIDVHGNENKVAQRAEMFKSMESWIESTVLPLLKPIKKSWQPYDFLSDYSLKDGEFFERVKELREMARELPDEYLVVLVGAMITEKALPMYQTSLNNMEAFNDVTSCSLSPWARRSRGWCAEENKNGDLFNMYLYLSRRVDMRQIQNTIQYQIGYGMVTNFNDDTYRGVIYTAFQERATSISHDNVARLAKQYGDKNLAQICGVIASDKKRHETTYIKIVEKLFEVDPDYTMLAVAVMMRKKISCPDILCTMVATIIYLLIIRLLFNDLAFILLMTTLMC
ncbi:hypothetical protein Nepgr_004422 [Nepenthes gracilis]|uniref:Stearoyl-[acyl-carrier-protein] 9-desaturase n=1 Tax=Nepenthes gracilis TaxID=150966 RepID=A0AAD3S1E0_NEPGR|nr:hypothetical protein Nepgr_004422 [Nepenthes gracilis]